MAGADPAGEPPRAAEQGTGLGRRLTMYGLMGVYVLALKGVRAAIPSLVPPRLCARICILALLVLPCSSRSLTLRKDIYLEVP